MLNMLKREVRLFLSSICPSRVLYVSKSSQAYKINFLEIVFFNLENLKKSSKNRIFLYPLLFNFIWKCSPNKTVVFNLSFLPCMVIISCILGLKNMNKKSCFSAILNHIQRNKQIPKLN